MKKVSDLTEETAEIRSYDGKQLGAVSKITVEDIATDCYIGKRAVFNLPKDMILSIKSRPTKSTLQKRLLLLSS